MDLSSLFNVFDAILKCPECNSDMSPHIDTNKKNGFSHYIVLQCKRVQLEILAVLAFREIGRGHNAMTTFTKIMNMPTSPTRKNFTKIKSIKRFYL